MEQPPPPASPAEPSRALVRAWALFVVGFLVLRVSPLTFVDPDLFHQVALAREIFRRGAVPMHDTFAYTPTLHPLVHHEWGTGVVSYLAASALGASGFLAFKYALVVAIVALAARAARRGGATALALLVCALPAAQAAHYGFTTIRAGVWSMVALATLANLLRASDRRPAWAAAIPALFALWINLHAGFVVGLGLVGLHALERIGRREPWVHLALAVVASSALTLATPWGLDYPRYLRHGLTMNRASVTEWEPLWASLRVTDTSAWLAMVLLAAYGLRARGLRACAGASAVAVFAYFSLRHHRHLTLFAVVWFAAVPAWLAATPLLRAVQDVTVRASRVLAPLLALTGAVWLVAGALERPWALTVPSTPLYRRERIPTYPVGAADYLVHHRVRANVMTPFVEGAYMMWRLAPQGARISFDSRYEAAYPRRVADEHFAFYDAAPGWPTMLRRYPTDIVLVPRDARVAQGMATRPGWRVVYADDLYLLVAREGLALPFVDLRGYEIVARFP